MSSGIFNISGGVVKTYANNSILFREDEIGSYIYILVEGKVEITKKNKIIANISETGSTIGEVSLLLGLPYSATCKSIGETKVVEINFNEGFFEENPYLLLHVARDLAEKLITANKSKLIYL